MTALVLLPGLDGTATLLSAFIEAVGPSFDTVQALPREQPFVLLGESFSGPLALAMAANPPPNLVGLVLSTTFARNPVLLLRPFAPLMRFAPVRTLPLALISWWLLGRWATPTAKTTLQSALLSVEPAVLRARAAAALRADVSACLSRISVPVLYLRATEDRLLLPHAGRQLLSTIAHASRVDIVAPHLLLQVEPAVAACAVAAFAAKLGG